MLKKRIVINIFLLLLCALFMSNMKVLALDDETTPIPQDNEEVQSQVNQASIKYQTHVQNQGWQAEKKNGELAGTSGKSLRLEAIKISLDSDIPGYVEYITHIQNIGWENTYRKSGEISGTSGKALRLEAIKIRLVGEIADKYDIYYRVHAQYNGWLGWVKNGNPAGTAGLSRRLEAIEIRLVEKGSTEIVEGNGFVSKGMTFSYQANVEKKGWLSAVDDSKTAGTTGQSLKMKAMRINLSVPGETGTIEYITKAQEGTWESNYKTSGQTAGNPNSTYGIEAIKIRLTREIAEKYDIYYRSHIESYGWLGWAKNDEISGNVDLSLRIEAIEIKLLPKGTNFVTGDSYIAKDAYLSYQAHVQNIGDQAVVLERSMAGTTGRGLRMEAFKIMLNTELSGSIQYKAFVEDGDWEENYKSTGEWSGTIGKSKAIQLVRIKLTGDLATKYDVYYRVHSDKYGWLGWAKNDEMAGATYYDIQAIEVRLYSKRSTIKTTLKTANHYVETGFYKQNGYTYYRDKNGKQATDWIHITGTKYFFNSLGVMIGKNVRKVIDVSEHNGKINWDTVKSQGDVDGVILRISSSGLAREDAQLANNIAALKRLNIPYGIYIYSYAENYNEGKQYAEFTANVIKKYSMNPKIGIFLDLESNGITSYMGVSQYEKVVKGYVDTMFSKGYGNLTSIYTYKNYADTALNSSTLRPQITWIAQYNHFCTYSGSYVGWQYSSTERIPGISGNVDVSVWFANF